MKKLILMGRSESGKTTLSQGLRGEAISYDKTQYIKFENCLIDTPGEYAQTQHLGRALALYSYDSEPEDKRLESELFKATRLVARAPRRGAFLAPSF